MVLSTRVRTSMGLSQALVFSAKLSIIAELLFDLKYMCVRTHCYRILLFHASNQVPVDFHLPPRSGRQ